MKVRAQHFFRSTTAAKRKEAFQFEDITASFHVVRCAVWQRHRIRLYFLPDKNQVLLDPLGWQGISGISQFYIVDCKGQDR